MSSRKPHVFLIEDDEVVVGLVRDGIALEGWDFKNQGVIAGAIQAMRDFAADILLLDLNLPDGQGLQVCAQMRQDPALSKIPVIILTSKDDIESRLKGFAAGARDYVAKPFMLLELLARMHAHLEIKDKQENLEHALLEQTLRERVHQDVADMIVHDLRAPLATVKVTFDLIRKNKLISDQPYSRFLGYAEESVDFALLMVNDLLDVSAGSLKPSVKQFDLAALGKRLETMMSLQYQAKGVKLSFESPKKIEYKSDPSLLFRVLANLLINALKFTSQGGTVTLRVLAQAKGLRLEIVDSGIGIPDLEKEAIFEKFYRANAAQQSAVPGSGIGLAFCRMAVNALGGRIGVLDAAGGGACFYVELPGG